MQDTEEILEQIEKITIQDIQEVIEKIFVPQNMSISVVGNIKNINLENTF